MSTTRAYFEPGTWRDFSDEHRTLREVVEGTLSKYAAGKACEPIAVWGAFGAGKTQFLFWVAERCLDEGLVPVYLHLNDLLEGLPDDASPDAFRDHAKAFVAAVILALREGNNAPFLARVYRDEALLAHVSARIAAMDPPRDAHPVLLVDEVEQAYITLRDRVRADDRSPLRAWLEERTLKICAFAVGSMYVLGKADRERLHVFPIPAVHPRSAKQLFPDIPERTVNSLWWLSRGKPRHLLKAAQRFRAKPPSGSLAIHEFVKELDSVSQAPYDEHSQNVVPACYLEQFKPEELSRLTAIGPVQGEGDGRLFTDPAALQDELLTIVRDAFKLERVGYDLVRYVLMVLEAISAEGHFALRESDTPHLLRLAVDFLLEYERDRLEKDTIEGGASLKKLLEVHDSASTYAGQIFWKLQGTTGATVVAAPALGLETMAAAFPLPTTSPTLMSTRPSHVRQQYDETATPVFRWNDPTRNTVVFITSLAALQRYSESPDFRQAALAPTTGIVVLIPYDAGELRASAFLEWLVEEGRLVVVNLPLALTDFLLSLRDWRDEGADPFPLAALAEADTNLKRQVSFYRSRLKDFVADSHSQARQVVPAEIGSSLSAIFDRIGDKNILTVAFQQAFESLSPRTLQHLHDLRELVASSKAVWGRTGLISVADELLPHRNAKAGRLELAKVLGDLRSTFAPYADTLRRVATWIDEDEMAHLSTEPACQLALRSLWRAQRGFANEAGTLAGYHAQISDFVRTLKEARRLEPELKALGISVAFGTVGTLLEALPPLETVTKNVEDLLKAPGGADRRLAMFLHETFLSAFVTAVEPEVTGAKALIHSVRGNIKAVQTAERNIVRAATSESAQFTRIDKMGLQDIVNALRRDAFARLSSTPTLDTIGGVLDGLAQDLGNVESQLARLDDAYNQIIASIEQGS